MLNYQLKKVRRNIYFHLFAKIFSSMSNRLILVEMAILTRRGNKTVIEELGNLEVSRLIKEHEERERDQEAQTSS